MTKTAAIKQATRESDIYYHGGWVVRTWSPQHNAWFEHQYPSDWWRQSAYLTEWRVMRTLELLGRDPLDGMGLTGSLRDRVNEALSD